MTKTIKIIIGAIVVVIIVVLIAVFYKPAPKGMIKLGFIGPLTGNAASYGVPIKNAIDLAVDEVNSSGGVNGRKLQIVFEDGKCEPNTAATVAQKLINIDKVKIILGGMCSGETLVIAPIAEQAKVILLSSGSGSPDITNAGDYIFRNFPSDASSGKKLADVAITKNLRKIAILAESTDYAQAVKRVFVENFNKLGGQILTDESFLSQDTDFKTQLIKIKSTGPDAILFIPQSTATAILGFKQLQELDLQRIQILTNELVNTEDVLKKVAEGALYSEPYFNPDASLTKNFLEKYKTKYGTLGSVPSIYLAAAYDAVFIFRDAIEKYGMDTQKIKTFLYNIKNREGALGNLTIDQNGDALLEFIIKTIKDGKAINYSE